MRDLRLYQENALKQLSLAYKDGHKHTILMVATGGGKTNIASECIRRNMVNNKNFTAMFVCDRIELINQTSERFFKDGIDHGVIQADHPLENFKKNIQICSIQTLARRDYKKPHIIFIDEAHTLYDEHKEMIKKWPDVIIVGLTATPFTKGLGNHFSKLIVGANTKQLIDLGFLVKPKVYAPSKPDLAKIKIVKGDYDNKQLEEASNNPKLIGDIIEHYLKIASNKPTICFAVNIAHSKSIKEAFCKVGIYCEHLDAYTPDKERKTIIAKFKRGEIKVLTSVDILSKGFDYPGAEVAILARPTKSLSLYIQQVGRVLRISPETGKTQAIILDHSGNTEEHGFVDDEIDYKLDTTSKGEKSIIIKKIIEKTTAICPSCFFVKDTFQCTNCGFEHLPKNKVVATSGYLVEIEKVDNKKVIKGSAKDKLCVDKERLYSELLLLCNNKKWKPGRAYFLYNEITGEYPLASYNKSTLLVNNVSQEVASMVKHLTIKNAKSMYNRNKYYNKKIDDLKVNHLTNC